jgi:hypothetical protein
VGVTAVVGALILWLAGAFSGPEFKASFTAPRAGQAVPRFLTAGRCRLAVSGNEGATTPRSRSAGRARGPER